MVSVSVPVAATVATTAAEAGTAAAVGGGLALGAGEAAAAGGTIAAGLGGAGAATAAGTGLFGLTTAETLGITGGLGAVGQLGSGLLQSGAAGSAANANVAAQQQAQAQQQANLDRTRADLAPFVQAGVSNIPAFSTFGRDVTGPALTDSFNFAQSKFPQFMDQATLEAQPGYIFQRDQGLKALAASASARGLGISGNAMKGAIDFGTGLANTNFQTQFANQNTQFTNATNLANLKANLLTNQFSQLQAPVTAGQAAAVAQADVGQKTANAISNNLQQQGVATAAGITGQAQGLGNAFTGAGNSLQNIALLQALNQKSA